MRQAKLEHDPFTVLADHYPADALEEMRQYYEEAAA
jgi:hypothetical protein